MSNRDFASKQLNQIENRIISALQNTNRQRSSVTLIGASKTQSSEFIRDFHAAGLTAVGENYLQEAQQKRQDLAELPLEWHFIGHIQSNKTKAIADHFNWVHTVDRLKIANRLGQQSCQQPLNILIQLNIDDEDTKSGVSIKDAPPLCDAISNIDNLILRGFMLIPRPRQHIEEQRKPFALARQTLELTNQRYGLAMDSLSMGMSQDLEAAIAEGATMIRVGTDLFGARNTNPQQD